MLPRNKRLSAHPSRVSGASSGRSHDYRHASVRHGQVTRVPDPVVCRIADGVLGDVQDAGRPEQLRCRGVTRIVSLIHADPEEPHPTAVRVTRHPLIRAESRVGVVRRRSDAVGDALDRDEVVFLSPSGGRVTQCGRRCEHTRGSLRFVVRGRVGSRRTCEAERESTSRVARAGRAVRRGPIVDSSIKTIFNLDKTVICLQKER